MRDRIVNSRELSRAFDIGIAPVVRDARWLSPFAGMEVYLREKYCLMDQVPDLVYRDVGGTDASQKEILSLVCEHLLSAFPENYRAVGNGIEIRTGGEKITVALDGTLPDLITAAKLSADDLVLMRRIDEGWQLACGCVCFPSAWNMPQKIGKIMADVHAPVPGFETGTRKAMLIERMFDNLQVGQTVQRRNWSLHTIDDLHLPQPEAGDFADMKDIARLFFRGEIQTLTKLFSSSDILFTIGVYVDPLKALADDRERIRDLDVQLMALDDEQLDYKGLRRVRDRLHGHLGSMY